MKITEKTFHLRKVTKYFVAAFVLITWFWLTACERIVSGAEKTAVPAFSEPAVANLFAGWKASVYAVFSRNFDADMQAEILAATFAALKQDLDNELGNYMSRTVDQVTRADEFYEVVYQADFGQKKIVKITVAFHASDHSIALLAFDSENVSWSAFQPEP